MRICGLMHRDSIYELGFTLRAAKDQRFYNEVELKVKCEHCNQEKEITEIKNYTVRYESWEAYNCCCEECAKARIKSDLGITEDEIVSIE